MLVPNQGGLSSASPCDEIMLTPMSSCSSNEPASTVAMYSDYQEAPLEGYAAAHPSPQPVEELYGYTSSPTMTFAVQPATSNGYTQSPSFQSMQPEVMPMSHSPSAIQDITDTTQASWTASSQAVDYNMSEYNQFTTNGQVTNSPMPNNFGYPMHMPVQAITTTGCYISNNLCQTTAPQFAAVRALFRRPSRTSSWHNFQSENEYEQMVADAGQTWINHDPVKAVKLTPATSYANATVYMSRGPSQDTQVSRLTPYRLDLPVVHPAPDVVVPPIDEDFMSMVKEEPRDSDDAELANDSNSASERGPSFQIESGVVRTTRSRRRDDAYLPGQTYRGRSLAVDASIETPLPEFVCNFFLPEISKRCNKKFRRLEHLKRHRQTHDGTTYYHCPDPECEKFGEHGRRFRCRNDNLREHMKTHVKKGVEKRNAARTYEEFYGFITAKFPRKDALKYIEYLEAFRKTEAQSAPPS